jgi:hypothetical protein
MGQNYDKTTEEIGIILVYMKTKIKSYQINCFRCGPKAVPLIQTGGVSG